MAMNEAVVNENEFCAQTECASDIKEEKSERLFTQKELEEILSDRIQRERKSNEALSSVKRLLKVAVKKGLLKGNSYAEMADELMQKLKMSPEQTDSEESAPETEKYRTDICENSQTVPADADAEETTQRTVCGNDGIENAEQDAITTQDTDEGFMGLLSYIKAKYRDENLNHLFSGDLFERFARGRSGSLTEIVDDFFDFIGVANERQDNSSNEYSAFTSTAFSSQSSAPEREANLTKQQMEMAKEGGLSYREYLDLLESIPRQKGRKF